MQLLIPVRKRCTSLQSFIAISKLGVDNFVSAPLSGKYVAVWRGNGDYRFKGILLVYKGFGEMYIYIYIMY